jgi:hypothetical protein
MSFYDGFIYFLFFLRFSSIFFGITISYHKKIIATHANIENVKENEYHQKKMLRNGGIKKDM